MTFSGNIRNKIETELGAKIASAASLSGGCISDAYKIKTESGKSFFLKLNDGHASDMFLKEANGLKELHKAKAIHIPEVLSADNDFILLEFIMPGTRSNKFFEDFGRKFARLHKYQSDSFGFFEDNYLGSNPQKNIPSENQKNNWIEFYFSKRILFQYNLAEKRGYSSEDLKNVISFLEKNIEKIIGYSSEKPSLLHGDLWSGNFMSDENGDVCLIDPAVYYGHREADLAMTKLFGGFSSDFYSAYEEEFPLEDDYEYRINIYKLYHVLNHLNLFGTGYYSQAMDLIKGYMR